MLPWQTLGCVLREELPKPYWAPLFRPTSAPTRRGCTYAPPPCSTWHDVHKHSRFVCGARGHSDSREGEGERESDML